MDFQIRATPVPPPEPVVELGDPAVSWVRLQKDIERWQDADFKGEYTDLPYVAAAIRGGLTYYGGTLPPLARLRSKPSFRMNHGFVKVPVEFVRRPDADAHEPPMAKLKKQANALKLLLLLATRADRNTGDNADVLTGIAPGGLATMLGYRVRSPSDPAVDTGTQALRRARDKLVEEKLLEWEPDGRDWKIRLLSMRGDGSPWRTGMRDETRSRSEQDRYLRLPTGLARNGWLSVLPTKAVMALLVAMDRVALERSLEIRLTPSRTKKEYAVAHRTIVEGLGVLKRVVNMAESHPKRTTSTNAPDGWTSVGGWKIRPSMLQAHTPLHDLPPWLQQAQVTKLPGEPTAWPGTNPEAAEVDQFSASLNRLVEELTVVEPADA